MGIAKAEMKKKMDVVFRKYGIYLVFLCLIVIGAVSNPYFLTVKNVTNVFRQIAVTGVLALAEMVLIIAGQIDLSLGAVIAFSGMLSVSAYLSSGSLFVAVLVAVFVSVYSIN